MERASAFIISRRALIGDWFSKVSRPAWSRSPLSTPRTTRGTVAPDCARHVAPMTVTVELSETAHVVDPMAEPGGMRLEVNVHEQPSLRVVRTDAIRARLASNEVSEVALLHELASSDAMLETVSPSRVRCALVSYRQERATSDQLTLDKLALLGILEQADRLSVEALWLDCWCYRSMGDYNHSDFCMTLHSVLTGVHPVGPWYGRYLSM